MALLQKLVLAPRVTIRDNTVTVSFHIVTRTAVDRLFPFIPCWLEFTEVYLTWEL